MHGSMFLRFVFIISAMVLQIASSNVIVEKIEEKVENECNLSEDLINEIRGYKNVVLKITDHILNGKFKGEVHKSLQTFTDKFGSRMAGSDSLEKSIDYMEALLKNEGLENVHTEEAKVPHWIRGFEAASLVLPRKAKIEILGLGTSVGTPRGGIIGEVVAVRTFDELRKLPDSEVKGKIVVFAPTWQGYGATASYRGSGATEASKKGAIAALIRSATPFSIGSPHTGSQTYAQGVRKIPAACITVEDAEMILRMYNEGETVQIRLEMDDYNLEPVTSRNTVSELQGTKSPNKSVVILSGHLDSWDVGVGAMDDGGGAFISWKAVKFLKEMGLRPKRTIRSVLWTGEEYGYYGAKEYQRTHKENEAEEFNFFIESDTGTFDPVGLDFTGNKEAECIFREVLNLMAPLNATQFETPADGGPDISVWLNRGFPGASLLNKNDKYFWFHHTEGDRMLVEDPDSLDRCVALFASTAYIIADLSVDIPKEIKN
ncbi:carboxypeptidase Q-like [Episyrphus balteatus]|uniref:carboxypeptidase Q-like n=1 Tax=Episyrphus balteatus TaxID=286459 RepID=UPI002485F1CF|nr:carboxypeptidase Q-like [Episyrphus balteatus]